MRNPPNIVRKGRVLPYYTSPMRYFLSSLVLLCLSGSVIFGQSSSFVGRWDIDVNSKSGVGANWLGITDKGGELEVWFQPTGGHVHPVEGAKVQGSHLNLVVAAATDHHPEVTWDVEALGDKLKIVQKQGSETKELVGVRAPELKRDEPKAWSKPVALFNGKDLKGWEPIGDPSKSHWAVKDGFLVNEEHGANLKSKREFEDFKLHFEVKCPDKANSGFYLRGRYELQLEYEPENTEPRERAMGAIYGRIPPSTAVARTPNEWETFDVTLVGRTITVVHNGIKTIDQKEIEGITGGALNADEGKPGPFYIQGDHTGGLMFRNITISMPKK